MQTFGTGTQTYLYLNGIAADRPIRLFDNIELLPAQPDCYAELFLGLGKSDVDISIISLFLPLVQAQLRVQGADGKDTAMEAWNAVWDGLLLGAIADCEVMCNLQCDLPVEQLKPDSTLVVTNYQLRGLSNHPVRSMTDTEITWVEKNFGKARSLLQNDYFRNAVHCLASYRWHSMPRARLAIIWSGIEGLFGVDSEIVFRVSIYAAKFLEPEDRVKQIEMFEKVKELYKLRSKAVHGGRMKGNPQNGVMESAELLRTLIFKCAEIGTLPDTGSLVP
jgi:Apea-like HEPN